MSAAADATTVRRHLPPEVNTPKVHKALNRLQEKARRFDAALLVLVEGDMPTECRGLAERIARELRQ